MTINFKVPEIKELKPRILVLGVGGAGGNAINEMIENAQKFKNFVIASSRTNRKENLLFKILYFFHKVFTFLFSAKWISFGNFSSSFNCYRPRSSY